MSSLRTGHLCLIRSFKPVLMTVSKYKPEPQLDKILLAKYQHNSPH
jgi:hypothetical protein